jgi:hypothetical protein
MKEKILIFGIVWVIIVLGIYGWYSIQKKIKKNINDMDF